MRDASPDPLHFEVRQAADSLNRPEVQELVKQLSEYGLAVAVPHMHGENGKLLPLPPDRVAYEDNLQVTFPRRDDSVLKEAEPVMWGWDRTAQAVTTLAHCRGKFHH
ncbi:MAG TPA: hypothetical protein DCQ33_01785 [Nitrospira sp.]|nr:hypothetical protein [Nitrospira sp.]